MKAIFFFTVLFFVNTSVTLSLPPGSTISGTMLNSSTSARPLIGPYRLRNNGWPEEKERFHVTGTNLYWLVEYGRSVPLRWDLNVAEEIHEIEEQLRKQPFARFVHYSIRNGRVTVWFACIYDNPSMKTQEAAKVLGSIWALTVAFGPREIRPGWIGTADDAKQVMFGVNFPGIP